MSVADFTCSCGELHGFKQHHGLSQYAKQGKPAEKDAEFSETLTTKEVHISFGNDSSVF